METKVADLSRAFKPRETSLRLRIRRAGLLLLLSGIALILITTQAGTEMSREEIHQISITYTLTLSFRKERAYDYWWYSVLQGDRELRGQIATQLLGDARKFHPKALINNITIGGYEDAVESRIHIDSSNFMRRTYLKGHSIQLSFQVSNALVAADNGLINVTIPMRGIKLEAKTKIAASAYYGYLMCPGYAEEKVEANLCEVFNFQAFDRPFQTGSWKRKGDEFHRFVREECGIWGVIYKQMTISWKDESIKSSVMDRVAWSTVSFRDSTSVYRERSTFSRGDCLIMSLTGILAAVGSEDGRRRRALMLIITLIAVLAVAHIPKLIEFFAHSERREGEDQPQRIETVGRKGTNSTFNENYVIERTPFILDSITRVKPAACTTPTVTREVNVTHPFTMESDEAEIIPVFSEPPSPCAGIEDGIDPEGMNILCVARMTYTQTLGHRQVYANTVTPSFPTDYNLVSGRAWARACSLATRSDIVLSDSCDTGWIMEAPWGITPDSGSLRLRCRIAPVLASSEHWSYKDLAIPYYDPDTIGSISLVFDEFRRKAEPGTIERITGSPWSSYTEQNQCGSRGTNIHLSSPQTGSFRFTWVCQRFERHSGGIAYPLNYRVTSADTLLASWSVTRTGDAGNGNYGDGANNWPSGCGTMLIIVDENGNERNLLLGQVNQDPRWGDSLGGTLGYGGSAQNVDVNKLFQSTYGRTLEGCTLLSFYLYGWVDHCAWNGVGDYAFLDVSFSNASIKVRRDASARETIQIKSAPGGVSLASLMVHDSGDSADECWELEKSREIPKEIWGEILGKTVRIALGVEYAGGDIDLLFDNLAVKITLNRAKLAYSGGSLLVADQSLHELTGFDGGEVRCLGADFDAEIRCLVSKKLYTETHAMTIQTHGGVVHSMTLNAGYPISPLRGIEYSDYNATLTLPTTYSWIRVTDPAGIDITSQSTVSQYDAAHIELTIRSGGFESSRYGTYKIVAESPNRVRKLNYSIAAWNALRFSWECRDSENVSDGEWTLYVYDPDGCEIFSQSSRIRETTVTASGGDWTLGEGDKHGTSRAILVWHNGTEGGAADVEFQVCSIRIQCEDLDGNPLPRVITQLSRDGNAVREMQTDGSGAAGQTLLPGRYGLDVRVDGVSVGGGSVDIQAGEALRIVQCSVCSPELRVLDRNEGPIIGAETAIISPNGFSRTILTDGYGKAQLRNIVTGNYEVSVLWRGLAVGNSTLSIRSSTIVPIVCDVHTLTVSICDSAGGLLPYSTLVVDFPNGTERTAIADGFGKVEFEQVPGGTHRLRVYWMSRQVYDDTAQFSSSSPIVIYTTVEPRDEKGEENVFFGSGWGGGGGSETSDESSEEVDVFCSLTVEVVDGKGGPVQGAEVRVIDAETGQLLSTVTTSIDGTARTLVKVGRYELEVQKDESIARKVVEVRSDRTVRILLELEEEKEREDPPLTIVSAGIAVLGSVLYLAYRRRSES